MKMDVDAIESETFGEEESDKNLHEGPGEDDDSSDSEDSDGNETVLDPKIQQLELQVSACFCTCLDSNKCHIICFDKLVIAIMVCWGNE